MNNWLTKWLPETLDSILIQMCRILQMMSESQQIRHCCVMKVNHNVQVQECTRLYVFPWKWDAYRKQFYFWILTSKHKWVKPPNFYNNQYISASIFGISNCLQCNYTTPTVLKSIISGWLILHNYLTITAINCNTLLHVLKRPEVQTQKNCSRVN